jgi:hypothetical protein
MSECPYCGAHAATPADEVAHMNAAHPDIVRERLERAGMLSHDRSMYGFSAIDTVTGERVDPRNIKPPEGYVADYRVGPDLPSYLTIGELQMVLIFATRYALEATEDPSTVNKELVAIHVRDRGPGSTMPASWVEFSVGDQEFAFWRATMDLYRVINGAVEDDPIHYNDAINRGDDYG